MSPRERLSFCARLALFLVAASSPLSAQSPPAASAVLDASVDAVWNATIEALQGAGYRVRDERRAQGTISARRTRIVGRRNEEEATQELRQICQPQARARCDARGLSEYYVTLTARIRPSDGKTEIDVTASLMGVFRRRGGAGAPQPVALFSSGFLEQEFVQLVRDRLAHGAPEPTPSQP